MSEVRADLKEPGSGAGGDQGGPCPDTVTPLIHEASWPDLQGLPPAGRSSSADISPSPPAETSGLLSLPWEIVTHIASHLPAQCVITVLPKDHVSPCCMKVHPSECALEKKTVDPLMQNCNIMLLEVCHALGIVGKDSTALQLRARRLIGPQAGFPVGPREDFDWPAACLEIEQLITCWKGQASLHKKDCREGYLVRQQQRAGQDREPGADGQDDGREAEVEGAGVAVWEAAYGADEGMEVAIEGEDGEMQPIEGEDQVARLREEVEERLEIDAAALMEEERDHRMEFIANDGQDGALNHQGDLADPRNLGNGRQEDVEQCQPCRSPSPPPALECIALPTDHFAHINSVLLIGGEGKVLATGSRDRTVKLWDLQAGSSGTLLHTLVGHQGWVWCLACRGSLLASGGFDSTVRLWDLQAGGAERGLIRAGAAVLCLSCQPDVLLAGAFDKRVSMYDTRVAEPLVKSLCLHGGAVMCLAADDKYIISGGKDCTVSVYDRRAGKALQKVRLNSYLRSISYSGSEIWAGDNKGMLHSFSMRAGTFKTLSQFDVGHTAAVNVIHSSPGSLYTCSSDRTVKVHIPCAPPRTLCTLHYQAEVSGLSVDAGVLAVASGDVCLEVWRPRK